MVLNKELKREVEDMENKQKLSPELQQLLEQFVKERNAAFLSKDKDKIVAHCRKYNCPVPSSEESFWIMVHKVIANIENIDQEQRDEAIQWLKDRGYSVGLA